MKVIIDTNIIFFQQISRRIPEKVILWVIKQPNVHWFISKEILDEYSFSKYHVEFLKK
jgi:predicted nucleic acid-binding protein